jgi:hypothetical protein
MNNERPMVTSAVSFEVASIPRSWVAGNIRDCRLLPACAMAMAINLLSTAMTLICRLLQGAKV